MNQKSLDDFRATVMATACNAGGPHDRGCRGCNAIEREVVAEHKMWGFEIAKMWKPSAYKAPEILAHSAKMMAAARQMAEGPKTVEEFAETFFVRVVPKNNWESTSMEIVMKSFAKKQEI